MIKHNNKKLSLSTQILRTIRDHQLAGVAGGLSGVPTACNCTNPTQQPRNTCAPRGCVQ